MKDLKNRDHFNCIFKEMMFSYTAPFGGVIKVVSSRKLTEEEYFEITLHEKVKGLEYYIEFNGERAPWSSENQSQANALALGMQWGAYKILTEMKKDD
jgi:hypothetical protein